MTPLSETSVSPQRAYRIYMYLLWDARMVARIEVDDHRDRVVFPEVFPTETGSVVPASRFELVTKAELVE